MALVVAAVVVVTTSSGGSGVDAGGFLPDEPLPATGTHVIRVIHTGGSHEPFAIGFFGDP